MPTGFKNVKPSLYFQAARVLANMEVPDFKELRTARSIEDVLPNANECVDGIIFSTFFAAWEDPNFLPELYASVNEMSGGRVTLREENYRHDIMSPYTKPLILTDGTQIKKVVFCPSATPFYHQK